MTLPDLRYAPAYAIKINGQNIPHALRSCVTSIRYQDGMGEADRVEIGLANPDLRWLTMHIRGLGFQPFPTGVNIGPMRVDGSADGLFDIDNTVELSMGYAPDPLENMFLGEVTGLNVSFPNSGMPTMTLVAHDYLNRLSRGRWARGFGLLPDFLVTSILSAENLVIPMIDPTIIAASTALTVVNSIFGGAGRRQTGSDLQLMQEIAQVYDADFWVDGQIFYLSRFMKEYSPRLTLTWGASLLDFSPRVSTVGTVVGVAMKFTLREIPLDFLVSVSWDFDHEAIQIRVIPGIAAKGAKALLGPTFTFMDQTLASPADITSSALLITKQLRNKLNNRLTGTGSSIGDPRIRAGAVIALDGLGPDFSGNYRVSSATHAIDGSGYRTTFEVHKEIIP